MSAGEEEAHGPRQDAGVIQAKFRQVRLRREQVYSYPAQAEAIVVGPGDANRRLTDARLKALDEHLAGVSLSGGGVRSGAASEG